MEDYSSFGLQEHVTKYSCIESLLAVMEQLFGSLNDISNKDKLFF